MSHENKERYSAIGDTSSLIPCGVCQRMAPFTAAVLSGLPLGRICTCAIEQRAIDRVARQMSQAGPIVRVKGH